MMGNMLKLLVLQSRKFFKPMKPATKTHYSSSYWHSVSWGIEFEHLYKNSWFTSNFFVLSGIATAHLTIDHNREMMIV